jgi:hypothetical protein
MALPKLAQCVGLKELVAIGFLCLAATSCALPRPDAAPKAQVHSSPRGDSGRRDVTLAAVDSAASPTGRPSTASSVGGTLPSKAANSAEGIEESGKGGGSAQGDLAKASQNPVGDLISLPFQYNANFNVGPKKDLQSILNIQPVVPIHVSERFNLIARAIVPIIDQPSMGPGLSSETGLGDIQLTGFLSPAKPGKIIWGVGPVFRFPTATDDLLGAEKWSAGPSAVVLTMRGPWVYGALVQNVWSFAGDSTRADVNEFLLNPFVNYNLPKGWYITSGPNIVANWEADDSDDRWTVPIGGGFGRVTKIGKLPVNIKLSAYYNMIRPDNGADWTAQLQLTFLFPK